MRIGILHRFDVTGVRSLSGYPYFMARAIEKHVGEVVYIGHNHRWSIRAIEATANYISRISYATLRRRISPDHNRLLSKQLARSFGPRVRESRCDVIFAPNASAEIAYLSTTLPIVYLSDLLFANIVDYYPGCSSLFNFAHAEAERVESSALKRASAMIYPSEWVAKTAVQCYGANPSKVYCIPYGANFDAADIPPPEVASRHTLDNGINLLWVGVDWERKGGPIAYECLTELLSRDVEARLVVCGCSPPRDFRHPKIEIIPFLDKHDPVQRRKLSKLFLDANFFLFPTTAEAFGIVLSEASAHGLPSLVRDTGGVGGAIVNSQNGYLLPRGAGGPQYADKILEIVQDRSTYDELVVTSRKAYDQRLNWDAWGRAMKPIFEQVARERRS